MSPPVTEAGAAATLAGLPGIGAARLRLLLRYGAPTDALAALVGERPLDPMVVRAIPPADLATARAEARRVDPHAAVEACAAAGVEVLHRGDPRFPPVLAADPDGPAVLFVRGDVAACDARRVAIVGTRNATAAGLATARELASALCAEGVTVVSGLARGIDGAAHEGMRRAGGPGRPVAVVGSGPDVVYPKRHRHLWDWVVASGLLVSEYPPGTEPDAWRFPERNRIIAGLAEVLVVVESRERGGSLITVRQAIDRDVRVLAVPGSPTCRASAGTNQLLVDRCADPVTSADDVLVALGLDHRRQGEVPFDTRPLPSGHEAAVLEACERGPSTLDMLASATGLGLVDTALAAARLERAKWLIEAQGWFETTRSHFRSGTT